ncbi:MAG TPA: UDP-glucose 4-epimerase GalE [Ignavibacteriales bacterium]|jgi:UDP-glucose 4-epimerase|nr:UDP-glucose 4-epimerase GalE [Ignavibacteriales bacterium]
MRILVTGGAGYIGSHTVKQLIKNNYDVVVLDNLSRGHKEAVHSKAKLLNCDLLNYDNLLNTLKNEKIDAVIHFAAFAYVGESTEKPDIYYRNNVVGSYNLINAVKELAIKYFIFSSTCSVYGNPLQIPISEEESIKPINPYAKTKKAVEFLLEDFTEAYDLKYVILRYFNAAGSDPEAQIGESHDPETHLIPLVINTALGKRDKIKVFGNDYNTPDGTCIRDYIHVDDLADAHIKALEYLVNGGKSEVFNLGTGEGYSVLDIINAVENITNLKVNYEIVERRAGDPAILVADNKKAIEILNWNPKYNLNDIITTAYKWFLNKRY